MKNTLTITRRIDPQTAYAGLPIWYKRYLAETLLHGFSFRAFRNSALQKSTTSQNRKMKEIKKIKT